MEKSTEVLFGMAAVGLTAVAAFVAYRRQQTKRVHRVEDWVSRQKLPIFERFDCRPSRTGRGTSGMQHRRR